MGACAAFKSVSHMSTQEASMWLPGPLDLTQEHGGPQKTSGLISSFSPAGGECGSPVRLEIPAPATAREPLLCIQHMATRLVISRKASDAYLREEGAKSSPPLLLRLTLRPPLLREGRGSGQRRDVSCPPSSRGPCWYHQAAFQSPIMKRASFWGC